MPQEFATAVDLTALFGGAGVIIWWFLRRAQWKNEPANVLFKAVLSVVSIAILAALGRRIGFSLGGAFMIPFACVALGVILSIAWAPHIGEWLAKPFTALFDGGGSEAKPQALYSIAESKIKKRKFHEAVRAIHEQLQKFPTDMRGQVMLAQIQAENLDDLRGAQITIDRLCQQRGHAPASLALALSQLADWHLKFGQDVASARQTLEKIIELVPDSEQAQMAAHRIAHLGSTDSLLAAHDRQSVRLPGGVDNVGLLKDSSALRKPEEDLNARADQYVKHLEVHPLDSDAREKLALIYAEHYQRLDLATDQLELLIAQPNQPAKQKVRWLNLLATLHIQHGQDYEQARAALQRIVDSHPGTALAAQAEQRIAHLKLDLKGREETHEIKLGTYEQNLGLKKEFKTRRDSPGQRGL